MRYLITAATAFAFGVLVGIGIAEIGNPKRLNEAESHARHSAADLKDAQELLRGVEINLEFTRKREMEARRELTELRRMRAAEHPSSQAEIREAAIPLAQIAANAAALDEGISDDEWQELKSINLEAPPKLWSTDATSKAMQESEFHAWAQREPFLSQDVVQPIRDWIAGDEQQLDVVVTNEPTGAQYRVTGRKRDGGGAECRIKFIGNFNWE